MVSLNNATVATSAFRRLVYSETAVEILLVAATYTGVLEPEGLVVATGIADSCVGTLLSGHGRRVGAASVASMKGLCNARLRTVSQGNNGLVSPNNRDLVDGSSLASVTAMSCPSRCRLGRRG